jgi:predicted AlkP superfamily pyrophosphatase or phosphodiesterase
MQHRFGPQTTEAYEALGLIDSHIGKLVETLEKTGLRENTSIIITADHGFVRVNKQIVGTAVVRKAGPLETDDGKQRVQIISEGGTAMLYLHAKQTKESDRRKMIELFKNHEGIDAVIEPKNFAKYGYPSPEKNPFMADLVLSAKDGYSFSGLEMVNETMIPTREEGIGSHGYLSTNPKMNALFVASGRGIAKGKKIGLVENINVAPTIAYLLGEQLPNVDGKVLKKILATP